MRELTQREKRTVRLGGAAVAVYLVGLAGYQGWKSFSKQRSDYQQLARQAQSLRQQVQPYETKVLLVKKLMEDLRLDPARLARATVVADASAAIQKAALGSGIMVGPVREEYARGASQELATIRLEANGPVAAVMGFLNRLESLGYPLILDSVQISSAMARPGGGMGPGGPMSPMGPMGPMGPGGPMSAGGAIGPGGPMGGGGPMPQMGPPGMLKLSLTIVVLNFEQWKNQETPNA
jgi:hypothetical protein